MKLELGQDVYELDKKLWVFFSYEYFFELVVVKVIGDISEAGNDLQTEDNIGVLETVKRGVEGVEEVLLDFLVLQSVEFEGQVELQYGVRIRVLNQLLFSMPRYCVEQLFVLHVEIQVLFLQLLYVFIDKVRSY